MNTAQASEDKDYVQSLARGLEVIRTFSQYKPRMTLSEVAQQTGLTRATARRFLLTLVREGYAEVDGKYFSLRPKVLDLGFAYLSSLPVWEVAQPIMRDVVNTLQESCSLAVLDGADIVYVAREPTARVMTIGLSIGSRLPAYCSSMGRVLLAGLPPAQLAAFYDRQKIERRTPRTVANMLALKDAVESVRRQGWALVDQELEMGLRSIAVPVRNRRSEVLAALNVSTHEGRTSVETMRTRFLPVLQDAAQRISAALPQ
ncbi:MAG: IclR family transcriptional regulator [Rhizobiales bacterium 24-66-13]|jgi:IclR family pca regulon transcriptional regulator|uniref:IclR family transcriptional regulator n=1 Tax=Roseixanthobacter finlandensis TaxID=3119922 RepID=UPI000BCBD233|nr:MAG: IclR family transcriptional regulator [Rhizobiales bacterium 35-66-30]OYZ77822.1 MAG: IclR family transcriptional regulator [Rhizobiales bacterium 24-66-13]OZB10031.1 MAG: IclR family transcriptional regulator [Rhizobiales bacterium 39-66-18]HQS09312.1 IclR family transcriptional regulator [Xanthobacteraceae bacterium]HQS48617.1 IclR family transcriptional regulator [Xanthobacteraceae bacterium]